MAIVNQNQKKIVLKIVFYGPGLSGKTTSVQYLSSKYDGSSLKTDIGNDLQGQVDDKILEQAEATDDYIVSLGQLKGFDVKVNLISVPGNIFLNAARQLLLRDLDGILFVADSQKDRIEADRLSIFQMRDNLYEELRGNTSGFPIVIMYNKRDLPNAASLEILQDKLNYGKFPFFETVATTGQGVGEAFKKVCSLAFKRL